MSAARWGGDPWTTGSGARGGPPRLRRMPGRIRDEDVAARQGAGRHRRGRRRARHAAQRRRRQLQGAVPLPRREVALVQRAPARRRSTTASAAARAATSSRSSRRSTTCPSPRRSSGSRPRYGIQLRYEEGGAAPGRQQGQRTRLVEAHRAAAEFYAEQLDTPAAGAGARSSSPSAASTRPPPRSSASASPRASWDALAKHLRGRGFTDQELVAAGLASGGPARADRPVPRPAALADPRHHR